MAVQEPVAPGAAGRGERARQVRRVAFSGLLGTVIEYYDFLLYSTMAALVLGTLYFPGADPATSTIASFGTLAAGYVARPLGGVLFGHFGDRLGRKSALVTSMLLMGVASVLIGVLPTYATLGLGAPLLLVLLRVVQGIAVGGEYGGAALMVIEHADPRRRGAWAGIMQMGSPLGALMSNGAVALVTLLPREEFLAWGWRIPFLASAVLLVLGLYVRLSVAESPLFREAVEAGKLRGRTLPLVQVLREPRTVVLACAAGIGPFALTALIGSHSVAHAASLGYELPDIMRAHLLISVTGLVGIPLFSALSDRIGRRPVLFAGALGAVVFAFPMYALIGTGSVAAMTVALVTAQVVQNLMYAPLAPMLSEMFGTRVRYTGVSLGYQVASLLGAGFTPMAATALLAVTGGSSLPLSWLIVVAVGTSTAAVVLVSETRGRDLRSSTGAARRGEPWDGTSAPRSR
ncbi:MFS transporter [Saccharopolyspora hordei]|uniref:MFS family permease n=1 Tax=Saccharopolyspora hordei TaxID=1838 RepID=A0A853AMZ0_9PSEU|nr:MFS transporter [Saccharopolyspora hordei]NYI84489.1 MFS family permease [Saccharopolyspora hordei]